jgi:hypothetical protein
MAKSKKKSLLPKRIAGVKVPKAVRKGRMGAAITSPSGRAVLAELIMAAAAVAGAKKVKDSPKARNALSDVADRLRDGAGDTGKAAKGAGKAANVATGAVTFAVAEAARAFVDALERRRSASGEEATAPGPEGWTEAADALESKKKPSSFEGAPH